MRANHCVAPLRRRAFHRAIRKHRKPAVRQQGANHNADDVRPSGWINPNTRLLDQFFGHVVEPNPFRLEQRTDLSWPWSSCLPRRVPSYNSLIFVKKPGLRCFALSYVEPCVTRIFSIETSFFMNGVARGVVATSKRGASPRRSPNMVMSKISWA